MNEIILQNAGEISTGTADIMPVFESYISYIGDRSAKTVSTYITNLRQFAAYLLYHSIRRPERSDIINYKNYLLTPHESIRLDGSSANGWSYKRDASGKRVLITCKPGTVKNYLQTLKTFFKWTAAEGIYKNIAENIHAPKTNTETHKKDALTADHVAAIEQSISQHAEARATGAGSERKDTAGRIQRSTEQGKRLFAMYLLTVNAGLRTIELERANIKDLTVKDGKATLYIWGKGHAEPDQAKALAPEVYRAIEDYLQSRTDDFTGNSPLFVSTGNRSGGKRIAARTISQMLKQAMKDAGFDSERITAHSLRHTAGTAVMQMTGDLFTSQRYMRHCNPATTEIYLHVDTQEQERRIADNLYGFYHGETGNGSRDKLQAILNRMSPEQVETFTSFAAAMVH